MSEEWREVSGFPGYHVSSMGRVRGKRLSVLQPHTAGQGKYLMVTLFNRLKDRTGCPLPNAAGLALRRHAYVHHLVTETFHGPRPASDVEAAHLNGVNTDNRAINLKWATRAENNSHKETHGTSLHGERNHQTKLPTWALEYIRLDLEAGDVQRRIAERWGVSYQLISKISKGELRAHG